MEIIVKSSTWLSNKLIALRRNWSTATPKQKWQFFHHVGNRAGCLIGLRFFGDGKINWYSYLIALVVSLYYTLAVYTIVLFTGQGQFSEGIKCLCLFGSYTSVRPKYSFHFDHLNKLNLCVFVSRHFLHT